MDTAVPALRPAWYSGGGQEHSGQPSRPAQQDAVRSAHVGGAQARNPRWYVGIAGEGQLLSPSVAKSDEGSSPVPVRISETAEEDLQKAAGASADVRCFAVQRATPLCTRGAVRIARSGLCDAPTASPGPEREETIVENWEHGSRDEASRKVTSTAMA